MNNTSNNDEYTGSTWIKLDSGTCLQAWDILVIEKNAHCGDIFLRLTSGDRIYGLTENDYDRLVKFFKIKD